MSSNRTSPQGPPEPPSRHVDESEGHDVRSQVPCREIAVLLAVSHALVGWERFEQGSERLLRELAGALGLPAAALWLPQDDMLLARAVWSAPDVSRRELEGALAPLRLRRGFGLSGCAWERSEPIQRATASAQDCFTRRQPLPGGISASVALPVLTGEEVLGVVELYSASQAECSERMMRVLGTAGHVLGGAFARRRGGLVRSPLTARELEVLALAAHGLTRGKIAERLSISSATVKTHFEHIYTKLGVSDRVAAVAHALRAGLID